MSEGNSETAVRPVIRPAPLSPHLQIWRWHITMAASILTRATGIALYGGLLIIALGRHGVRAGREDLGDAGGLQPGLGASQRRAESRTTGADDNDVIGMVDELVGRHECVRP
jgi:hypothetical protein